MAIMNGRSRTRMPVIARTWAIGVVWAALTLSGCAEDQIVQTNSPDGNGTPPTPSEYTITKAFPGIRFDLPVDVQNAGDGSGRLFVVEQSGRVLVFTPPNPSSFDEFLDIRSLVNAVGFEEGLLGLAFDPNFASANAAINRYYFVYYTVQDNGRKSRVSRYRASAVDPNTTEPGSRVDVITFDQPFANHNGGQIAFGPDNLLYIGLGDGGSANDPDNRSQDLTDPLGSILRIDVSSLPYSIPGDNPFAGNQLGYVEEIYAYGLRNPWRFSFDPATQMLWCGDVGQNAWEEVDIIVNGGNYGWKIMEGMHCRPPTSGCATSGLRLPVWEYTHAGSSASITGGHVYRGTMATGLAGKYIYGDYTDGRIWALETGTFLVNELIEDTPLSISSFGVDESGELYLCALDGYIYKFIEE
jgi:glucose/arabinose dehydrogenase